MVPYTRRSEMARLGLGHKIIYLGTVFTFVSAPTLACRSKLAEALPPPDDVPEEVLREEVILQGRSPIDGSPLSPMEYAELELELAEIPQDSVAVNPEIQSLVFQLKLLRLLKDIVPFW